MWKEKPSGAPKYTKTNRWWGSATDLTGGAYNTPRPPAGGKGARRPSPKPTSVSALQVSSGSCLSGLANPVPYYPPTSRYPPTPLLLMVLNKQNAECSHLCLATL